MNLPDGLKWKLAGPQLGKGGQGAVFPVQEQGSQKKYAMKIIDSHRPAQAIQRFHREIEAIKRLDHPSIVKLVDASKPTDPFQYYVMNYVENAQSIRQLIDTGKNYYYRSPTFCISLFITLLEVIRECIAKGVVHRDLSPGNVLSAGIFNVFVIDFGLCQISDGVVVTLTDEGLGTRNYAAPEIENGSEQEITWKADLYSAAKIVWTALTGQMAFAREAPAFKHKSVKHLLPDHPLTWHFREIFLRTIRHDQNKRFGSIDEALAFARSVEQVINAGKMPLELHLTGRCPACGLGTLGNAPYGHDVFGNPNPPGVSSLMCTRCGMYFARSQSVLKESLADGQE